MAGRDGAADPAFDLDAENECQQQVDAAHAAQLGEREQRRRHRSGRMDDGGNVGVAKIEHIGGSRVEERGTQRIRALAAANHGRLAVPGKFLERLTRDLHRRAATAGKRDGEKIQ